MSAGFQSSSLKLDLSLCCMSDTFFFANSIFSRMNFVSTSCSLHLAKMEFLENKHKMQAFLSVAESKIKSWIIKYGRQESVGLMLDDYIVNLGCFFSLILFLLNFSYKFACKLCKKDFECKSLNARVFLMFYYCSMLVKPMLTLTFWIFHE